MNGFPWWGYVLIGVAAVFVWRVLFRRDAEKDRWYKTEAEVEQEKVERQRVYKQARATLPEWAEALDHFPLEEVCRNAEAFQRRYKDDMKFSREYEGKRHIDAEYIREHFTRFDNYYFYRGVGNTKGFLEWLFPEFLEKIYHLLPNRYVIPPVVEELESWKKFRLKQAEEARMEEPEQKPEPEAGPQEQERQAESRYTPEQDAARARFYLPEGFTCAQLQERYTDLVDKAPSDQFNRVNTDYEILIACCD